MKLYEINEALQSLMDQMVDPETGEISTEEEELQAQIDSLEMEKRALLEYLAKMVLNGRAEAIAIKEEESRLKKRRKGLENNEEKLMSVLKRECPKTTRLGIATLRYQKTKRVDVTDEAGAIAWLKKQKMTWCINQPAPTVYKTEVRRLIESGKKVPGCQIIEDRACSLR